MSIKRIVFYIISVITCFLLQTTVFDFLKLADVVPNILLILTVTMGFIRGKKEGIVIGFICGLLIDIFSGDVLGQYALVYLLFGYANGWFHTHFYEDDILLPMGLLAVNSLAYSVVIFFFFFAVSLFQRRSAWIAFTGQPFAASNTRKNRSFAGWESTVDTRPMT